MRLTTGNSLSHRPATAHPTTNLTDQQRTVLPERPASSSMASRLPSRPVSLYRPQSAKQISILKLEYKPANLVKKGIKKRCFYCSSGTNNPFVTCTLTFLVSSLLLQVFILSFSPIVENVLTILDKRWIIVFSIFQ